MNSVLFSASFYLVSARGKSHQSPVNLAFKGHQNLSLFYQKSEQVLLRSSLPLKNLMRRASFITIGLVTTTRHLAVFLILIPLYQIHIMDKAIIGMLTFITTRSGIPTRQAIVLIVVLMEMERLRHHLKMIPMDMKHMVNRTILIMTKILAIIYFSKTMVLQAGEVVLHILR